MEGPRAPAPSEYPEIVNFLDKSLRPDKKWSIVSEYPTALSQVNLNNIRIIKDNGEVLSHAVLKPLIVKTPVAVFKAGAIGSVVTNSSYRSQGLSKQIIDECLDEAQKQDCDFAILWTNLYDFYRKFGFELTGNEISIIVENELSLPAPSNLIFREGSNVDPAAIYKLYSRHTVCTVRTVEDIRNFLKIPNARIYTAWDSQGALAAYAIEGKGVDLDGYIHEWGGGVSEVVQLTQHIYKTQQRPITLIAPIHSVSLIEKFRSFGCMIHEGHLGMIKILKTEALFSKITRHARNDHGMADFVLEKVGDEFHIGTTQSSYKTSSEREVVSFLFGPSRPSDIHKFEQKTADKLNQIFPLRLWFWGWDSI